jgi:hypothetical protein
MPGFLSLHLSLARNLDGPRPDLKAAARDANAIARHGYRMLKRTPAHSRPAETRRVLDEIDTATARIRDRGHNLADVYSPYLPLVEGIQTMRTRDWHRAILVINDLVLELDRLRITSGDRHPSNEDRLLARCAKTKCLFATGNEWRSLCLLKWTWCWSRGTCIHPFVSRLYRERLISLGQIHAAEWLVEPASQRDSLSVDRSWIVDQFLWKEPRGKSSHSATVPALWPPILFWSIDELIDNNLRNALTEGTLVYGTARRTAKQLGWRSSTVESLLKSDELLDPQGRQIASLGLAQIQGQDRATLRERMAESLYLMVQGMGNHYDLRDFFDISYRTLCRIEERITIRRG